MEKEIDQLKKEKKELEDDVIAWETKYGQVTALWQGQFAARKARGAEAMEVIKRAGLAKDNSNERGG